MGPFPHDAPAAKISADNPMGTDGFEFVEYAHPNPEELQECYRRVTALADQSKQVRPRDIMAIAHEVMRRKSAPVATATQA